jgi:DnaJ-class molecular chaperone
VSKSPYDILGVSKTASDEKIKTAYRVLAKMHHPDLNPNNKRSDEKFKAISAAYDLLKDKEKRSAFDRGEIDAQGQPQWSGEQGEERKYYRDFANGPGGARYHSTGANINPEDLENIFGSMFGKRPSGTGDTGYEDVFRQQQSADVHYRFDIDFMEASLGAKKQVTMPDGKSLKISIPEGVKNGQKLRLKGQGQELSNGLTGDAYVEIHVRPHKFFTRKGQDIYTEVPIGIHEAILGGTIEVETIHSPVKVIIPKGTSSGKKFRLKEQGIKGGHHYVGVRIVMPVEIDTELEKLMKDWMESHKYNPRKENEAAL